MKRIDVELVKRGLFETRSKAQFAIKSGVIYCNGNKIVKNNYCVEHTDILEVRSIVLPYVSKGGLKLEIEQKSMINKTNSRLPLANYQTKLNVLYVIIIYVLLCTN